MAGLVLGEIRIQLPSVQHYIFVAMVLLMLLTMSIVMTELMIILDVLLIVLDLEEDSIAHLGLKHHLQNATQYVMTGLYFILKFVMTGKDIALLTAQNLSQDGHALEDQIQVLQYVNLSAEMVFELALKHVMTKTKMMGRDAIRIVMELFQDMIAEL